MADEIVSASVEPSQLSEPNHRIFSIHRKARRRKAAQSGPATPSAPESHRISFEERFDENSQDKSYESEWMQQLIETARGVALILSSARDDIDANLAWNLGMRLETVAEIGDAYYFGSLGELNDAIGDKYLEILLKRKLKAVRAKIAESKRRK